MRKYYGIDWLRALSCLGILAMHMASNNAYAVTGWVYERFILSFTDLVYLFMTISAFGMCCGYFERVMSGKVNWTDFYKKRYLKILPFFAFLILIDLVMGFSISSVYEGVTELTLLHGFVPADLTVIGVGWFLGTIFIFYLVFPFFCVLIEKKLRAWIVLALSLVLNFICINYFDLTRSNFLYSLCFFIAGGLIFQYKDKLQSVKWYIYAVLLVAALCAYYLIGANTITRIIVSSVLLMLAISLPDKKFKAVSFISGISMEIYLSHMVIFRGIEKFGLNTIIGNGLLQYVFTVVVVIAGAVVFSYCCQEVIKRITAKLFSA